MITLADDAPGLDDLKHKIFRDRGFHCHLYRDSCLRRRVAVRMRARGIATITDYASLLDSDDGEYDSLIETLTINVTRFFRDPTSWQALETLALPRLLAPDQPARSIWSVGCASGEEPFSLAILLREGLAEDEEALARINIIGSDVDGRSIQRARAALYPDASLDEVSPERRARWFSQGSAWQLDHRLRRMVSFVEADVITGELPQALSMILCRNVMIYFDRALQDQLLEKFHAALEPGGILMLGRVETMLGPARPRFRPLSIRDRIYQKI